MQLKCINMLIEIYPNATMNQVVIVLGNWLFAESLLLVIELGLGSRSYDTSLALILHERCSFLLPSNLALSEMS